MFHKYETKIFGLYYSSDLPRKLNNTILKTQPFLTSLHTLSRHKFAAAKIELLHGTPVLVYSLAYILPHLSTAFNTV